MTKELTKITLGIAEGAIEAGEQQQERLEEVIGRIETGEFHKHVSGIVPRVCIDGRPGGELGPSAAGGTFTLTVADDLTTQRFSADRTLVEADRGMTSFILNSGEQVGGHCDNHAQDENCGCGAKDRIGKIYEYMVRRADDVRSVANALGVEVTDEIHEQIIANAARRNDFSTGAELSTSLKQVAGEDAESKLRDAHKEVVVIVNMRHGTSLDREALAAEFGEDYQAFNIDAWSFPEAAKMITATDQEANAMVVAMVYYNLGTGGVLCGKNIRVVVVN